MAQKDVTNTFIAAASFGKGRIVAFSWEGLTNDFIKDKKNVQLYENIIKWTTKSREIDDDVKIIDIERITEFKDVSEQFGDKPTVIAWRGSRAKSEEFMQSLRMWIGNGGAFVCGVTPWAWARGGEIQQIPTYDLLKVRNKF